MSSLKLELGSPACSELCQHPSCWPSFSPAPRSRGLLNPRLKRLLEAQTELSESVTPQKLHLSEQTLPTLKILDIGESATVDPVRRPSPPSIFPAVHSPKKTTRTASKSRNSRSRSLPLYHEFPPSTASSNLRKSPLSLSRTEDKKNSPKHLPIRLNYVTVHDPVHPVTSPSSRHPTWVPASASASAAAAAASSTIAPLHISPLKNVTSQLISRQFEDEGLVISAYPKAGVAPTPAPVWDAWEETVFSLARAQLTGFPTANESDANKMLLSSRSDVSYLSNRDLFLSGRGLWRPIRSNKRHLPGSRQQSRSLTLQHNSGAQAPAIIAKSQPQLRQVSLSLDSIPYIPKRVPVVLERFLSHQPGNTQQTTETDLAVTKLEDYDINDKTTNSTFLSPSAPPPTPNCSQTFTGRRAFQVHLPASPPLHPTEP